MYINKNLLIFEDNDPIFKNHKKKNFKFKNIRKNISFVKFKKSANFKHIKYRKISTIYLDKINKKKFI